MTLTQMYKRIYATIGSGTERKRQYVTDEDILEFLNAGQRLLCITGKCFSKNVSLSVTNGTTIYPMVISAPDMINPFDIVNASGVSLNEVEPKNIGKLFAVAGDPMWWYYIGKNIVLHPAPTASASYLVWYHALASDLASGTDEPVFEQYLHMSIVDFALAQIYLRLGVMSLAQQYAQNFSAVSGISLGLINDKLGIKAQSTQPQGA